MSGEPINAFVVGAPRQGKTRFVRTVLQTRPRVVYYDPAGDVRGVYTDRDPEALAQVVRARPVYDAVFWADHLRTPEDHAAALYTLYDAAQAHPDWVTIVIDELYVVTGDTRRHLSQLMQRTRVAKHPGNRVSVWVLSQRATDASPNWHAVMERVVFFKVAGVPNYRSIRDGYGADVEARVRALPRYHYLEYDTLTGDAREMPPV